MDINSPKIKALIVIVTLLIIIAIIYSTIFYDKYSSILENDGYKEIDRLFWYEGDGILRVYKSSNGEIIEIAHSIGYGGEITFYAVFVGDQVKKVKVLNHNETPAYGGYITEKWFLEGLAVNIEEKLKVVKMVKKNENEIVAITGATISTQAIVTKLNDCIKNYEVIKDES